MVKAFDAQLGSILATAEQRSRFQCAFLCWHIAARRIKMSNWKCHFLDFLVHGAISSRKLSSLRDHSSYERQIVHLLPDDLMFGNSSSSQDFHECLNANPPNSSVLCSSKHISYVREFHKLLIPFRAFRNLLDQSRGFGISISAFSTYDSALSNKMLFGWIHHSD